MSTPNHLNPPNPNILPPYGDIQPPHEWPHTAHSVNTSLERIRENTRQFTTTQRELSAQYSHLDPSLQAQIFQASLKGRDFRAELEVDVDIIRDVARTENTEELLNLLLGENVAAADERRRVDSGAARAITAHQAADNANTVHSVNSTALQRVRAAQGPLPTMSAADKQRLAELESERMHHKGNLGVRVPIVGRFLNSHANYAFNIPGWVRLNREERVLADLQRQYDGLKRQRKLEDTMVNRPYYESANEELMARVAAERADQDQAGLGIYDTVVKKLFEEINDRRKNAVSNFTTANDTLNAAFDTWNLGEAPQNPSSRYDASDALSDMNQLALQELSPRDPAYRHALSRFVQQTVRLEERAILESANDPLAPVPSGTYTPDGGILMHAGTPEAVVFFDDGSMARSENGSRRVADWTRRNAAGQEINPRPQEGWPQITEQLGQVPLQDVFNRWEQCRSPESAARLHAEYGFHIKNEQAQERAYLASLETIADRITELDNIMRNQGAIAADTNRSPEDRQAARDANAQAAAEKGGLVNDQNQTYQDLGDTHSRLVPMLYGRDRLTVADDGRDDTPTMATSGTAVVYQNRTLYVRDANGGRGGMVSGLWGLKPNGGSVLEVRDPATGRVANYRSYHPDGSYSGNASNF